MTDSTDTAGPSTSPAEEERLENARVFGQMLRAAREVSGYTLDELAQATRIAPEFVRALEAGRFDELPGDVFARGFVRSICKAVGEDATDYLEALRVASKRDHGPRSNGLSLSAMPAAAAIELRSERRQVLREWIQALRSKRFVLPDLPYRTAGILAGVVVLIPLLLWLVGGPDVPDGAVDQGGVIAGPEGGQAPDLTPEQVAEQVIKAELAVHSEGESAEPEAVDKADATSSGGGEDEATRPAQEAKSDMAAFTANSENTTAEQVVDVKVLSPVEIRVSLDGGPWKRKAYEPGEYRFTFSDKANVLVMDASRVELSFNNRSLGSLGNEGRVRRLSFSSGSVEVGKDAKGG